MLVIYTKLCLTFFLDHYAHKNKKKQCLKIILSPDISTALQVFPVFWDGKVAIKARKIFWRLYPLRLSW